MKKIKLHILLHVPFEGLGCIEQWIVGNGHTSTVTEFYKEYTLPGMPQFDWLIVMGGPMGVYDETEYPWLLAEKAFIRQAIDSGKTVIGICLGTQLIAEVLDATVYPNHQKEIGWFDIKLSETAKELPMFVNFEEQFKAFHWHGDTYDLPVGSKLLFSSDTCRNQAFLFHDRVLGLQFHFEVTETSLKSMVKHGKDELVEDDTIQTPSAILGQTTFISGNNRKMFQILDYLANTSS